MPTRREFLVAGAAVALHPGQRAVSAEKPTNPFLAGNFAPVREELTVDSLKVIGRIPADLDGMFVRNGPNPQFPPVGAYHWFEGDGMLHGVRIRDGKASYRNRFIRTKGFEEEKKAGKPLYPSVLEMPDLKKVLAGENPFKNAANTALVWHAGKCFALYEAGEPHEVKLPTLDTVGPHTWGGKVAHAVAAHPKVDPLTGEMLAFGYVPTKPLALLTTIDANGGFVRTEAVKLDRAAMIHDFAITKNFAVFPVCPETFDLTRAFKGGSPWYFDAEKPMKFGLVPRSGSGAVRWFDAKTCFVFHILNAYETATEVVVTGCRYPRFPGILAFGPNDAPAAKNSPIPYRWKIDLKTSRVTEGPLDDGEAEFPRTNERFTGQPHRYGYWGLADDDFFKGFAKYDFDKSRVQTAAFGPNRHGGEGVFVARPGGTAEDDGWLMTYLFDKNTGKSELVIHDAKELAPEPLARVLLPARVPYGFHGLWAAAGQLG